MRFLLTIRFPDNTPIPGTSFTVSSDEKLREGLALVKKDNGYWPTEDTTQVAHGVISMWAPELVIVNEDLTEILLTLYETDDPRLAIFKDKWHMPGGYNRWHETFAQTCERIAKREVGTAVHATETQTIGSFKWESITDDPVDGHPYGRPLSVYTWAIPMNKVEETDKRRFFLFDDLPSRLIGGAHRHFFENHKKYVTRLKFLKTLE